MEKVNFKELKYLSLAYNKISDTKVFERVDFPLLNNLRLNGNEILDISSLAKLNAPKLKILYLENNKIDKNNFSDLIEELKTKFNEFYI